MNKEFRTVYVAQHGETEWSLSGQLAGTTDLPLTSYGEHSARRLRVRLHELRFAKVFTSPRQRTRTTCELAECGSAAELDLDLVEWNYGQCEGRWSAEIRADRPDWDLFRHGCPAGEKPKQVIVRADRVISRIRAIPGDVLLFTCRQFTRVLAARWIGLEPISSSQYLMLNAASLCSLGYEPDRCRPVIRLWNDTSHLDGETKETAPSASQGSSPGLFDWNTNEITKEMGFYQHKDQHLDRGGVNQVQWCVTSKTIFAWPHSAHR